MLISHLTLASHDLGALAAHYGAALGLPVLVREPDRLRVRVGQSQLTFVTGGSAEGFHHFAWAVPAALFAEAKDWLAARTPLLRLADGRDQVFHHNVQADAVYWRDPVGNIGELIAYQPPEPAPHPGPFGPQQLLRISEVGLVTADALATVAQLGSAYGLRPYQSSPDPDFNPVGDRDGMLIVVRQGRPWFMDGRPAHPATGWLETAEGASIRLAPAPAAGLT